MNLFNNESTILYINYIGVNVNENGKNFRNDKQQ